MLYVRAFFFAVLCAKSVTSGADVDPAEETTSLESVPKYDLYTAVSCKFAGWTVNRLYDALKLLPLFDQYKYTDDTFYDELLVPLFKKSMVAYKKSVDDFVETFVDILHDILATNYDVLYYSDKTILKTLVSVRIKSHYATARNERSERDEHVFSAIRLLLADMNALQSYSSMNCPDSPSPDRAADYFYGYWINVDKSADDIEKFLSGIQKLHSESPAERECTVPRLMWENFVSLSSDGSYLNDILAGTEVAIAEGKHAKIGDVLRRLEHSYDPDMVFRYQDSVLHAVIKLVLKLIIDLLDHMDLRLRQGFKILEMITEFYESLSPRFDHLPEIMVKSLNVIFEAIQRVNQNYGRDILKYYNTLAVGIRIPDLQFDTTNSVELVEFFKSTLTKISDNIVDFECVQMSIQYLHDEPDRYYIPFVENKEDFSTTYPIPIPEKEDDDVSENTCEFLLNTYTLCFEIFRLTNLCRDYKSTANSMVVCNRFSEMLTQVKYYFLNIVENGKTDVGLLKMSYTIATVLVNLTIRPQQISDIVDVQRILEVIMTELNNNGFRHCTKKTFNFLLFNNINFIDFGNFDVIEKSIGRFLNSLDGYVTDVQVVKNDCQMDVFNILSLKYLKDKFIKDSTTFETYEKKILFHWKGTIKTTKNIYEDIIVFASNPLDLNSYYDIYFKFYIAVVYYEVRKFLILNDDENDIRKGFDLISNSLDKFQTEYFPTNLAHIISDIQNLYMVPKDESPPSIAKLHDLKDKIDVEFKKLNIMLKSIPHGKSAKYKTKIQNIMTSKLFSVKQIRIFSSLNTEVSSNVNVVNSYFLARSR